MSDDWANRFMPGIKPDNALDAYEDIQSEAEPEPITEPVDQPTIADVNEILISLKNIHDMVLQENIVLMSALDIIRQDQRLVSNENKQILLALTEVVGQLNERMDSLEGAIVRKMGQLEFAISKPPPEPMTNVMELDPGLLKQIREDAYEPHPEDVLGPVPVELTEGPTIHDLVEGVPGEVLDAYHDWKHGKQTGSSGWHAFMRVCKGAKEAKGYRDEIERQLA
tara:strand:- start:302 stop:973 length:672 start_codon:yes stop_codon:yes gene_type:complete